MKELRRDLITALDRFYIFRRKTFLNCSQAFGLYVGQPQVLYYVRCHPGCAQNEIADELGVSPASIAFSTKRLQKAGFLQKVVNNLNMRCNSLYVTPEGEDILDRFQAAYEAMNDQMFEGLSPEELKLYTELTERINQNMAGLAGEE